VLTSHSSAPAAHERQLADCFELMETLVQRRQEPIRNELEQIRKLSMLHLDVLLLIYHFAKSCPGQILEIGAFLGGATMAAALGVRDSGTQKRLVSIEPGGSLKHPQLPSRDIYRDLQRNLHKHRLADLVTLINGRSFQPTTIAAAHQAIGPDEIGLLIVDADGQVKRDLTLYGKKLADSCAVLIDDYLGPATKAATTRKDVDELAAAGRLEPLGFYGWGTWVGRWRARSTTGAEVDSSLSAQID
jgi:predicted O-methyltransferase YrrM